MSQSRWTVNSLGYIVNRNGVPFDPRIINLNLTSDALRIQAMELRARERVVRRGERRHRRWVRRHEQREAEHHDHLMKAFVQALVNAGQARAYQELADHRLQRVRILEEELEQKRRVIESQDEQYVDAVNTLGMVDRMYWMQQKEFEDAQAEHADLKRRLPGRRLPGRRLPGRRLPGRSNSLP